MKRKPRMRRDLRGLDSDAVKQKFKEEKSFTAKHLLETIGLFFALSGVLFTMLELSEIGDDTPTFEQQIETLNEVVESIDTLKVFVENQKNSLKDAQLTLSELQQQRDILKPVIEANQETVDALFAIQAQKERKSVWLERAIGFFLGIAGSLIASLIWAYFKGKEEQ